MGNLTLWAIHLPQGPLWALRLLPGSLWARHSPRG